MAKPVDCGPNEIGPANRPARSAPAPDGLGGSRASRRLWKLALVAAAAIGLLEVCFLFRAELLPALAKCWIVDEPVAKADAIVILGGLTDLRPFVASRLYHDGVAPRILYMDVRSSPGERLGIWPSERELTRRILLSNNVPDSALVSIGHGVTSTYDEACAVRAWMEKTGARSVVIPTDLFPSRRTRWIFQEELKNCGGQVHVEAIAPAQYSASNWWQHEEGLIGFQNECVKFLYYRWKY